jgi:phosphohistidine phosphatase SixA
MRSQTTKLASRLFASLASTLLFAGGAVYGDTSSPLSNEVILIIRHAEKQPDGPGLTPDGVKRANIYVQYFENFQIDGALRRPDSLFAAADSSKTQRCRLTITPLANALNLPINATYKNKDVQDLARCIEETPGGKTVLIAWHHEEIEPLLEALGAASSDLVPPSGWPEDRYNWLIELRYDNSGHLIPALDKLISEHLLPGDTD